MRSVKTGLLSSMTHKIDAFFLMTGKILRTENIDPPAAYSFKNGWAYFFRLSQEFLF